jgi:16S rRNA (uracil1498-N3)-methyltransferase
VRKTRLYTPQALKLGQQLELEAEPAHHLLTVLKGRVGHSLELFNGDGCNYRGLLKHVERARAWVDIAEQSEHEAEPALVLTLVQAVCRGEKMDWVVQKAVELGVSQIEPIFSERTEVHLSDERSDKRLKHWRAIAVAACEQSGRTRVPEVSAPVEFKAWLSARILERARATSLMLEPKASHRLREMPQSQHVQILVGPEGGFSERELDLAREHGVSAVRMGPRVLRTETAGIAALAALQSLHGDF